jgi:hypothetical protein
MTAINTFCRHSLAALTAFGLIFSASQGFAEDATPDYTAPLDMTSTYAGSFEHPDFLPDALYSRAMAAPETTGMSGTPPTARKEAAASPQESKTGADMSDNKYNR